MIQGTPEWFQERVGRITASRFGDVIANPKTKRYNNYKTELALELSGTPVFENDAPWHDHGKEMEPRGRGTYSFMTDNDVKEIGVIVHPKYDFISCSPDGIIGDSGGLEIKSRISHKAHIKCVEKGMPSEHKAQVQGSLWVTGREWWDFVSYFEDPDGLIDSDITIDRIYPDEKYHKKLEKACLKFWDAVQEKLKCK